jgi:hypothetical protein
MRRPLLAALLFPAMLMAQPASASKAAPAAAPTATPAAAPTPIRPHAELKTGTAVEKLEIAGETSDFKVAAGTRIYVWAKVMGAADTTVTFVFSKGDKTSKQELKVPRSPYRTNAYKTFRKGDEGEWTVKLMGDQDAVLGLATFKVDIQ